MNRNPPCLLVLGVTGLAFLISACEKKSPPAGTNSQTTAATPKPSLKDRLLPGYDDAPRQTKCAMLDLLDRKRPAGWLSLLLDLHASETDPEVKMQILYLLGETKDPGALPTLAAAAAPGQPKEERIAAIESLGITELDQALPLVASHLADPDDEIRESASFEHRYLTAKPAPEDFNLRKRGVKFQTPPGLRGKN